MSDKNIFGYPQNINLLKNKKYLRKNQFDTWEAEEFIEKAFAHVKITIEWSGLGVHEVGKNSVTGEVLVKIDPRYFRPTEVELLCGDATKARTILNWQPTVTFDELVTIMMQADLEEVNNHRYLLTALKVSAQERIL